jgi:MFS family permease
MSYAAVSANAAVNAITVLRVIITKLQKVIHATCRLTFCQLTGSQIVMQSTMKLVWRYTLSSLIDVVAVAMMFPMIALFLNDQRLSPALVGIYAAVPFCALLANLPFVSLAMRRFGFVRMFRLGLFLSTLGIVVSVASREYMILCFGAALVGIGAAYRWTALEALIAWSAPLDRLGATTGAYQSLVAAAYVIGPFLVPLFGLSLNSAGLVAAILALAAWLPIIPGNKNLDIAFPNKQSSQHETGFLPLLPLAALGCIGGVFEVGLNVLGPVQAERLGAMTGDSAMILTGVIALASLVVQYPIGWLADRVGINLIAQLLCGALFLSLLIVPVAYHVPLAIWLAGVIWGGAGGAIYTLTMIRVGTSHRGQSLAIPTVVAAYTVGGAFAPAIGGLGLSITNNWGLFLALGPMLLILWLLVRIRQPLPADSFGVEEKVQVHADT